MNSATVSDVDIVGEFQNGRNRKVGPNLNYACKMNSPTISDVRATQYVQLQNVSVNRKLVKMFVIPAHHNLQDIMEISDGIIATNIETPPDSRADTK